MKLNIRRRVQDDPQEMSPSSTWIWVKKWMNYRWLDFWVTRPWHSAYGWGITHSKEKVGTELKLEGPMGAGQDREQACPVRWEVRTKAGEPKMRQNWDTNEISLAGIKIWEIRKKGKIRMVGSGPALEDPECPWREAGHHSGWEMNTANRNRSAFKSLFY